MADTHEYARLFESAPFGIYRCTVDGRIHRANPALVELLGYGSEEEVLELNLARDVYADVGERDALIDEVESGVYRGFTARWRRADGKQITVRISGRMVESEDGTRIFESFVEDVSEEDRARRSLERVLRSSGAILVRLAVRDDGLESVWVSESVEGVLGYTRQEALAPDWWISGIHPDDREVAAEGVSRAVADGEAGFEYRFREKEGDFRWFREELHLVRDERGEPLEVVGVGTDITELKEREASLRRSEERFRRLAQIAPDAIIAADADGDVLVVNEAAERMFGYEAAELMGRPFTILFPERYREANLRALQQMLDRPEGEEIPSRDLLGQRKDASEFPAEVAVAVDPDGGPVAVMAIVRDVSQRVELETERDLLLSGVADVGELEGRRLISICSSCKNIRGEEGDWHPVEVYVSNRAPIEFSHGICPVCVEKLYGDVLG